MANQPDLYAPHRPVPAKPITQSFPTPELKDRILVVRKDARAGGYRLPEKGAAFIGPDSERFKDFKFATARPSDQTGWVDWFFVNERLNQDDYNFTVEYPWVDKNYPRVTRTYVILREDRVDPDPDATDPANENLSLIDSKITRLEDLVLDSLFIAVQNVFERVPAPIAFGSNKFDSVLPYKFRVAVPEITVTTIKEGAAQPTTLGKGQWGGSEETNTFNRRTVKLTVRNLPFGGVTFIGEKLTNDKQVATVTESWKDEQQHIEARPTLLQAEVEQVGDGTTIKSETEVDSVFPETRHAAEISDPVPPEFRSLTPTRTFAESTAGQVSPPELGVGELSVVEDQKDTQIKRRSVVKRDPEDLPATLKDYELGGIRTHGSEFGGTLETAKTLDKQPQQVEEGFDIIASSVKNVGAGLTVKQVTRLFAGGNGTGPYIELIDGGDSYVDIPAVIFNSDRGSGAEGTATISEIPITPSDLDAGGDFTLAHISDGDAEGLLTFLGTRYSNGTWANPTLANGPVKVSAIAAAPIPESVLQRAADHIFSTSVQINPRPGGSNSLLFDLGPGKSFTPNYVTLRGPGADIPAAAASAKKFEVWAFNTFGSNTDKVRVGGPFNIPAAGTWAGFDLIAAQGYRYLSINAAELEPLDYTNTAYPRFNFAEVEFYGDLTILPAVDLGYSFDGDNAGAFNYLGQRGGGGTWRNPHTNGDIEITAPNDALEFGTFDSMVDHEPSNTYLVDRAEAEIWFDLKENRSLLLRTLLYRQRADYNSPVTRFFVQGSMDGVTWEERQQCDVSHIASSWNKIVITEFTKFYRFFRLILPSDRSALAVGELELYGELTLDPAEVGGGVGTGSVTGVNVTNPGLNYAEPPNVVFSGGGGSGAAGTAVLNDEGGVDRVIITSTGGGYDSAPDVEFTVAGGSGATLTANISGGVVTSIDVDTPGTGYVQDHTVVKIVSATGSGATAVATVVDGEITAVTVITGGSDYALPPTAVVYPDTDPEADATIGAAIDDITLVDGGEGYTSPPAVHFDGSGADASATATLGFGISAVQLIDGGDGFTSTPSVSFTGGDGGSGATATAAIGKVIATTTVTAGGSGYLTVPEIEVSAGDAQFLAVIGRPILAVGLTARGSGYTSNPTVAITGDGSGATAHVIRSFAIASIAVSAGGSGYTTPPTVVIPAPTGDFPVQATAHAVLTGDAVTSIVIDNPGAGYLSAPTATLSGGDGTGATAGAVTLASGGAINSIVLDTAGTGYTEATVGLTGGGGSGATAVIGLNSAVAGPVKKVLITNAGTDYSAAPTLTILPGTSGGTGATATAALSSAGRVTGIAVTAPGSLYSGEVTLVISGGGGSGVEGLVILEAAGEVKDVTLVNPGSGFGPDTTVSFVGGGGSGASATASSAECGEVTDVRLTNPGGPFTVPPEVVFVGGQSPTCPGSGLAFREVGSLSGSFVNNNGGAHQTVVLDDGRVLATGGTGGLGTRAEIYDPDTELWTAVASMPTARSGHCLVKLADGKVLACGGGVSTFVPNLTCDIYDPVADTWTSTGSMVATGADDPAVSSVGFPSGPAIELAGTYTHTVVLDDGRIFCARGFREDNAVQIYDPTAGTWSVADRFELEWGANYGWINQRFTKLPDGNVLATFGGFPLTLVGGIREARYAIYDPTADTWTYALVNGGGITFQSLHSQILLDDGRVLVAAGLADGSQPLNTLLYDYLTDTWDVLDPDYPTTWYGRIPVKWSDGRIALVGGQWTAGAGRGYTVFDPATDTFTFHNETLMSVEHDHTVAELLDGNNILIIGGSSSAGVELLGSTSTPATAVYHLGTTWPTLIEEQTDPTEGIITRITKKIVPALTPLPAGYSESFPLDIYRSIHIVSKVDLHSLPPPEIIKTSQHVAFPQQLLAVYPIWDSSKHQSTAGGDGTGTNRGSVSASISVHGAIVVKTQSGFRGAAMGRIERQFFGSLAAAEAATEDIEPTIIQPASGTAILRGANNTVGLEGLTFDQSPPLNAAGNPAQPGDIMPDGSTFAGSFQLATRASSNGASGTSTAQVKELNDVLTPGLSINSIFSATNSSSAGVLVATATAQGSFVVAVPPSTPTIIVPGQAVLSQVVIERWRLGLFVRHLIYLHSPV